MKNYKQILLNYGWKKGYYSFEEYKELSKNPKLKINELEKKLWI